MRSAPSCGRIAAGDCRVVASHAGAAIAGSTPVKVGRPEFQACRTKAVRFRPAAYSSATSWGTIPESGGLRANHIVVFN